jgi:hypothetical protein
MLTHKLPRPSFRQLILPTPTSTTKLHVTTAGIILDITLWSELSGRKLKRARYHLRTRREGRGRYRTLLQAAGGQDGCKLCDSQLVWNERKECWFWHMTCQMPDVPSLERENVAHLIIQDGTETCPFRIETVTAFPKLLGAARHLQEEQRRLDQYRHNLAERYRLAEHGKGHGYHRALDRRHALTAKAEAMRLHYLRQIAAGVASYCSRHDCGTLIYRPSTWQKAKGWFARHNLSFAWERFAKLLVDQGSSTGFILASDASDAMVDAPDVGKPKVLTPSPPRRKRLSRKKAPDQA